MATVLLSLHLLIALLLIGVVLMQRSEGGGLGMGGGGAGGFMTGRGTANLLTRMTAALAALFFVTSISLTLLAKQHNRQGSPLDLPGFKPLPKAGAPATPGPDKSGEAPATPATAEKGAAAPASPAGAAAPAAAPAPAAVPDSGKSPPPPKSQ